MKLYYSPGSCALSPHIALHEASLPFELVFVDLATHRLRDGSDFYLVNPKGAVPVLELDDGTRLTEGPAVAQYIADLAPHAHLAPPNGTLDRTRLQEWLNFITSELHQAYTPFFNPHFNEAARRYQIAKMLKAFGYVDRMLEGRPWLTGDRFTIADGYLLAVARAAPGVGLNLDTLANLGSWSHRMAARPAVQAALDAESSDGRSGLQSRI